MSKATAHGGQEVRRSRLKLGMEKSERLATNFQSTTLQLALTPSHSAQGQGLHGAEEAEAGGDPEDEPLPELVVLTLDQDYEQVAATGG